MIVLDVIRSESDEAGAGQIVEEGPPHFLLQQEDSLFYKLSKEQHS